MRYVLQAGTIAATLLVGGCSQSAPESTAVETSQTPAVATPVALASISPMPEVASELPYEFIGVSAPASGIRVALLNPSTGEQAWIGLGESLDGIEAVSYNQKAEQLTVRTTAGTRTLTLREARPGTTPYTQENLAQLASQSPSPYLVKTAAKEPLSWSAQERLANDPKSWSQAQADADARRAAQGDFSPSVTADGQPIPDSPPVQLLRAMTQIDRNQGGQETDGSSAAPADTSPPMTPEERAVAEREARMLVSDLLEIGQIQRKAYEEKKAAEDAARGIIAPAP